MEREKEEEIFEKINIVEASVEKQNIQQKNQRELIATKYYSEFIINTEKGRTNYIKKCIYNSRKGRTRKNKLSLSLDK